MNICKEDLSEDKQEMEIETDQADFVQESDDDIKEVQKL